MKARSVVLAVAASLVASLALCASGTRWLNVHVQERAEGTEVSLHVPFNLVLAVVEAVRSDELSGGRLRLHVEGCEIDWPRILRELDAAPDGQYVTVKDGEADVSMSKQAGMVRIDVDERGGEHAKVKVRFPESLLAAFRVEDDGRLDIRALLVELESVPVGDLITVASDEADVRVWVE
ncbi:MAG: hypothetical protein ACOY3Y_14080 [Acidobacteriota bacterium]